MRACLGIHARVGTRARARVRACLLTTCVGGPAAVRACLRARTRAYVRPRAYVGVRTRAYPGARTCFRTRTMLGRPL
ncbi:hypothetical protein ACPCUV_00550 [Streptomyces platensis]|uniref:hypothetical protein n=1 Tax=Streptomyces platensis TaxID=58346 RepID=UPI003C2D8784